MTRNGALREEKCKHQVVCVRKGCSFKTKMKFLCVSGLSWHSAPAVRDYTFVIERDVLTPFPCQNGSCPPSDFHHTSSQTSCLVVLQSEKLQFHIFGAVEYGRLKIRPSFMLLCQQCSSPAYTGLMLRYNIPELLKRNPKQVLFPTITLFCERVSMLLYT